MSATPQEIAAAEAAADARLAAAREQIARERAAAEVSNVTGLEGASFGGSIVLGDQHGVSGGVHYGDVHPGHPDNS